MTSSMLAGERRWASARRGGMTVLGKVAVPKPLNLPSQKLENHGLDPNVEIVPKGSLSWGSRPSSSTSNPWGSSALSPTADGTSGSPSHPSGRPSSGGGLSRPSTAGSERMHEPAANTWGPNSRPSSASGVLTSNQSSLTSSRPHSADTRPGSSTLSRFAEPVADNSLAWGPNGTAEKLLMPSKNNAFSLSSGDFPTLGSEKDNPGKSSESHDHRTDVRPGSASGRAAPDKDRNMILQSDVKSGTVNTWTRDGPPNAGDGVFPEKWQGEQQQYVNPNVIPQHFDAWRGPPMNAPASVWYRGPPGCPPYPPAAHGGFPMEPFPYYRPQIPPALANSQPGPPPGAGPNGHHPKNGDFYRTQMPDAFMRPGMPMRPGFYPGPVPYDGGYYGPPMGYNPNERGDIPFMGMPPGPPVYNMYPGPAQNPSEPNDTNFRAGVHGPTGNLVVPEQSDSARAEESRGPYKVLRKRENVWDGDVEEKKREPTTTTNLLSLEKSDQPRPSFRRNEHGSDARRNEGMPSRINKFVENPPSRTFDNQGHSSDSVVVHSREGMLKAGAIDDNWGKNSEIEAISFPEVPQVLLDKPEDSSLIQKIEGLNAKVRASDVREDTPPSRDMSVLTEDDTFKSTNASAPQFSRRAPHGVQSRADHYNKGRLNNQDADGRRKKLPVLGPDSAAAISNQNIGHSSASFQVPDHHVSIEAAQKSATRNAGESSTAMFDSTDGQAQRAKMRELAKQRAIQLQKEEEERIREQKAKALAKLEELNRRSLAADGTPEDVEKTPVDGSQSLTEPAIDASKHDTSSSDMDVKAQAVSQISKSSTSVVRRDSLLGTPKNAQHEPVVSHGQMFIPKQNVANATGDKSKAATLVNDGSLPRQKRVGQRENQSFHVDKSLTDKSTLSGTGEKLTGHMAVSGDAEPSLDLSSPNNSNILPESTTHQRRKNNKSSKNKQRFDDASTPANETNLAKVSTDNGKPKSPPFGFDPTAVLATDSKDTVQPNLEQNSSLPSEEVHARANNQYKSQQSRRMPRNPQANRSADRFHGSDAVMWAPVRSHNKAEPKDETSETTVHDSVPPTKSISPVQPNLKSKRAEMERYVPKSAAKELALSSPGKRIIEDTIEREDLGSQPAFMEESKSDDIKQNKPVKPHGGWRQRGPTELHHGQGFQKGSSSTSNTSENHQKSLDQHESSNFVSTETNIAHEWDPSDGWFMPEDPPTEVAHVPSVVKDQRGVAGKGKRPTYKGQRSTVNNNEFDHKNVSGVEVDKNFIQSKENHPSQWQPRSQAYRGPKSSGSQNASSGVKKDSPEEYKNAQEVQHTGNQEDRRERRPASFKGRAHSPNLDLGNMDDEGPFQHHNVSSGFKKNGGQNNRSGRQMHHSHYKYQPVGSNNDNNNNNHNNIAAPTDISFGTVPRYKERGSGQSKRGGGNFNGRQSGAVRAEAGYE